MKAFSNSLRLTCGGLALSLIGSSAIAKTSVDIQKKSAKPNILVILCDDLGYCDVGFNGSPDIKTPELDRLASRGTIFTSAYVAHPFCGPSRASIMTGRYPQNIGTPYNLRDEGLETSDGVPVSETFMSNILHDAGYYTAALGKWHLGDATQFQPNQRGFDEFYGFLGGGHEYFPDQYKPMYDQQSKAGKYPIRGYITPLKHNDKLANETEYITDELSHQAIRIIKETSVKKQPFFMYLAYNAPHVPLQAKAEDLKKFVDIQDIDRRIYAAMVYAVDRGVGEIVQTLKANNQFDNTLIVFLSDNGGNFDHGANNYPLKGTKGDSWEGGYRVPMFFHWPEKIAAGKKLDYPVSSLDFYPTFVDIAQAKVPEGKILDGKDILGVLEGGKFTSDDRMIYSLRHREGYNDVGARKGDWKITRMGNEPWGLYNITNDIGEKKDQSGRYPERLKEMVEETKEWTKSHVKPLWVYSAEDEELWRNGTLPGYNSTFEIEKLITLPSTYRLTK